MCIRDSRKDAMTKRGDDIRQAHAKGLDATKQAAAIAWDCLLYTSRCV